MFPGSLLRETKSNHGATYQRWGRQMLTMGRIAPPSRHASNEWAVRKSRQILVARIVRLSWERHRAQQKVAVTDASCVVDPRGRPCALVRFRSNCGSVSVAGPWANWPTAEECPAPPAWTEGCLGRTGSLQKMERSDGFLEKWQRDSHHDDWRFPSFPSYDADDASHICSKDLYGGELLEVCLKGLGRQEDLPDLREIWW